LASTDTDTPRWSPLPPPPHHDARTRPEMPSPSARPRLRHLPDHPAIRL